MGPMSDEKGVPTNKRQMRKEHERQLLIRVLVVLVVVGGGLTAVVYGPASLLTALPCLLVGSGAIWGLYMLFLLLERWTENY